MNRQIFIVGLLVIQCHVINAQGVDDQLPSRIGYGKHNTPVDRISTLLATALRSSGAPDVLRHKKAISVEYSLDGSNWLNYQTTEWEHVLDDVSSTGWGIEHNHFRLVLDLEGSWIRPSAFLIGADWGGTDPSYYIKIESSNDNSNWTERLPFTYSGQQNAALNIYFTSQDIGVDRYIRLTFNAETPAGKIFHLMRIAGFTQRFYGISKDVESPLHFLNDGFVGIGTTTPSHKLEVNGTIRSKEVKVEASNWPDYVFEPNYKLESIESLEAFIQSEGHLPEIPSAAEMEAEGLKLGEMNRLLLQKIEELTLYTIEQEKKIEKVEQENSEFKIQNSELKDRLETQGSKLENIRQQLKANTQSQNQEIEELRQELKANSQQLNKAIKNLISSPDAKH